MRLGRGVHREVHAVRGERRTQRRGGADRGQVEQAGHRRLHVRGGGDRRRRRGQPPPQPPPPARRQPRRRARRRGRAQRARRPRRCARGLVLGGMAGPGASICAGGGGLGFHHRTHDAARASADGFVRDRTLGVRRCVSWTARRVGVSWRIEEKETSFGDRCVGQFTKVARDDDASRFSRAQSASSATGHSQDWSLCRGVRARFARPRRRHEEQGRPYLHDPCGGRMMCPPGARARARAGRGRSRGPSGRAPAS